MLEYIFRKLHTEKTLLYWIILRLPELTKQDRYVTIVDFLVKEKPLIKAEVFSRYFLIE
jgi:hypothetical protein